MRIKTEVERSLSNMLNVIDGNVQEATYYGVAHGIIMAGLNTPVGIVKALDYLREIAIIRPDLINKYVTNLTNISNAIANNQSGLINYSDPNVQLLKANSFLDLLGVYDHIGATTLLNIDRHFNIYKEAAVLTLEVFKNAKGLANGN